MGVLYKSQNYATRSGVYASIFIPIDLRLFLYLTYSNHLCTLFYSLKKLFPTTVGLKLFKSFIQRSLYINGCELINTKNQNTQGILYAGASKVLCMYVVYKF